LFLIRSDVRSSQFAVVALAAICLLVVFGLTMAINVPINNTLMTWNASAPPGDSSLKPDLNYA
jgi:uncharacterized membrane protein